MKPIKYVWLLLHFVSIFSFAQEKTFHCHVVDERGRYREHGVDFREMALHVSFKPEEKHVIGDVFYTFAPIQKEVDTLFLDAPGIDIQNVFLNDVNQSFRTIEEGLIVYFNEPLTWDETYSLRIKYEAFPKKGIYFIGWTDSSQLSRKQIWTQGQGIDNRHWIPGYDDVNDKLMTETIIEFDKEYEVVSNGELLNVQDDESGKKVWHYKMNHPHSLYLVMIAIGKYDYQDYVSNRGVVSRQYYYPDREDAVSPTYQYSADMMDWMEEETGIEYPWGSIYRNVPVQDFMYGAMENTMSTIFTDYYLQDSRAALERNYIGTNAHELAHQWFGDYVTEWSAQHHWLHESFATHYAKHFRYHIFGEEEFQWIRRNEVEASWKAATKNDYPVAYSGAGSARHYPKGSFVLDMLRYVVGEEQYKKVIHVFLKNHAFDMVDTHDFYLSFMKVLGINLDWFFDQWIYKGGEPHYSVSHDIKKNETIFFVQQIQAQNEWVGLFKMPIVFQVYYKDGSVDEKTVWIEQDSHEVVIPNTEKKKVDFTLFDPNWNVLKKVDIKNTYNEWAAQAYKAPNMIDRYDAIIAMEQYSIDEKRTDLIALYEQETDHLTKTAIIKQLVNDHHLQSQQLIQTAMYDSNPKVRRAVIDHMEEIPEVLLPHIETLLEDASYVTIEKTMRKLTEQRPEYLPRYLETIQSEYGMHANIRILWLQYMARENEEYVDTLLGFASPSFEFRTRLNALEALQALDVWNETLIDYLINAMVHFNRRLSGVAKMYLEDYVKNDEERRKMFIDYINSREWNETEQAFFSKIVERKWD